MKKYILIGVALLGVIGAMPCQADGVPTLNRMVETYKNSPFEYLRLSCEAGVSIEHIRKASTLSDAAGTLIECMTPPLKAALRESVFSAKENHEFPAKYKLNLCGMSSTIHIFYQANLPFLSKLAIADGWPEKDYASEMREDYGLFCAQYQEGLLSDIATLYGLNSVVTGYSELGKSLAARGVVTYQDMSRQLLLCSGELLSDSSLQECKSVEESMK
jgi:hypothetical protein